MTNRITDEDVRFLAGLSAVISADHAVAEDDPWLGSPFEWILRVPSRTKGAVGESLVAGWAAAKGFDVARTKNSDSDRLIHGHRVEVKMSTLWKSGGFKFQQIRDQDYDFALCIGISPFDAQAWLIPKLVLKEHVIGHMGQHTGAEGADTSWIGFQVETPFDWMEPYGDRLSDVARLFTEAGRGPN